MLVKLGQKNGLAARFFGQLLVCGDFLDFLRSKKWSTGQKKWVSGHFLKKKWPIFVLQKVEKIA